MATMTGSAAILLVSTNPTIIEATRTILAEETLLDLINKDVTLENLFDIINETRPDIILLDFEFTKNPLDLVEMIVSEYINSSVVAILSESEIVNLDRVILSGARAFVQYPYQSDKLVVTLTRVVELLEGKQSHLSQVDELEEDVETAYTLTVFSPKGGVGTTTIATNLAISLHKTLKKDVLLVDGKLIFGHVALYLNLLTGNSITDLIAHAGMLDQKLIEQVVVKHASGIFVLPSPNSITEAQGIGPENLFKVIQGLQQVFPIIVIDGGNDLNENAVTFMDSSEKILLALNPDLASMRDVRQFMEIAGTLSYPKDKTLLILNLTGRKADVKKEEIEDILKMEIYGKIPADENLALSSINEGVPILVKKPRHPISKAFIDIAKDLGKSIKA